jgi:hypothetical protein
MIPTSYLYVGVHYSKNSGVSSKLAPVSTVTLWIYVVMTNCCWKLWNTAQGVQRVQFIFLQQHEMHLLVLFKDVCLKTFSL